MRQFQFHRDVDDGGVSGTGIVAEGVQFQNGKIALTWLTKHTSIAIYDDVETLEAIHGHQGKTRIVWLELVPLLGETSRPQRYARCLDCGFARIPAESMGCTKCQGMHTTEDALG